MSIDIRPEAATTSSSVTAPPLRPAVPAAAPAALALEPRAPTSLAVHAARAIARVPRADLVALAAVVVVATVFAVTNVLGASAYQDDEGTYTSQAIAVQNGSLAPYTYWYDHPPFGWLQLALLGGIAGFLQLGDGTDIGVMRYVMCLYFVADAVLIYGITRRMLVSRVFSLAAVGFFVFSPLSLGLGRQVFLDNVAMPWVLLAFFLVIAPRVSLWSHAASGVAFAMAVLTKLTAAAAGPALLFALLHQKSWRGRSFSVVGFLTFGSLVLLNFPVMAVLRGELFSGEGHVSLQDGLLYQFATRGGSGFVWENGSDRQNLLVGWMQADGFLIGLGVVGAVVCLAARRTRWIPVAIACFFLPIAVGSGYLPGMYIAGGIPFFCIAIATAADLARRGTTRFVSFHAPRFRYAGSLGTAIAVAVLASQVEFSDWIEKDTVLMTEDANAEWRATLAWAVENVPHDDVVLTPYSMWQDLNTAGWNDPWTMIVLEKADLDSSEYTVEHPDGWKEIGWIIEGPTVAPNLGNLGLQEATSAFDHSTVVQDFGSWRVRQVDQDDPLIAVLPD